MNGDRRPEGTAGGHHLDWENVLTDSTTRSSVQ